VPSFAATDAKAIVLVARNEDKLKTVAESVAKSHPDVETLVVPTDVANPDSVAALFETVTKKYGHADVLINNAAIFKAIAPIKDVDQASWWEEMVSYLRAFSEPRPLLIPLADPQHPRHLPNDPIFPQTASDSRDTSQNRHPHVCHSLRSLPRP
jgi:hypothetical protein